MYIPEDKRGKKGAKAPQPRPGELPRDGESPMRDPIRVISNQRQDQMDVMSHVNYNKVYTVEHNVKVYDFGEVHPDDLREFLSTWRDIYMT